MGKGFQYRGEGCPPIAGSAILGSKEFGMMEEPYLAACIYIRIVTEKLSISLTNSDRI